MPTVDVGMLGCWILDVGMSDSGGHKEQWQQWLAGGNETATGASLVRAPERGLEESFVGGLYGK